MRDRLRRGRRSQRDRGDWRVLAVAGGEERDRALVIRRAGRGVYPLVQFRNGGENEREKKQAKKSGGQDRDRPAATEMPLHSGRVCVL